MKTTYRGTTTNTSDNLLDKSVITKNKPVKSYKFDVMSLYYDGKYYFPEDIKANERHGEVNDIRCNLPYNKVNDKPYQIQVVYYDGKWMQDTHYITEEFKNFINLNK